MQTLVKRRSDGGIQEWSIEVVDNAFRVTSGKQGGNQKLNESVIVLFINSTI